MSRLAVLALALALGCAPDDGGPGKKGTPTGETSSTVTGLTGAGTPTDSGTGSGTTSTETMWTWDTPPWEEPVDCEAGLEPPLASTTYGWVPSHEDFTFSPTGHWVGVQGENLVATPWGGPPTQVLPGIGPARGTRFLPDGTIVIAETARSVIMAGDLTTGASWTVASGLNNPNGIAIGLDGWIYVATLGRIVRIDPADGTTEDVATIAGRSFDGLSFSPDFRRLYFNEEVGQLHFVDFDEDGNPGPVVNGGRLPVAGILDGMTVDACGNLYAVVMGGTVWRVTPTGEASQIASVPSLPLIATPALNFGPGVGGFERDHLYVQDFLGKMYDIPVGIPGKWEPHLPWE